tara:strand:- start:2865 stop:3581 length:717 start_codon:yes stop_codon:yes gene_type:complete
MTELTEKIGKIYYINLDRRPDRNSHMINELQRVNVPEEKIERFTAIDGLNLFTHGVNANDIGLFRNSDFIRKKNKNLLIGNQLSHMRLIDKIIENKYEVALIMQDDLKFMDTFNEELNKIIGNMPDDTEIVWIGFHKVASGKNVIGWDLVKQTSENNDYYERPVNEYLAQCKLSTNPCSTAYIITQKGAQNFKDFVNKVGFRRATDGNFNDYLRAKNIDYCSRMVLCTGITEFGSDIF